MGFRDSKSLRFWNTSFFAILIVLISSCGGGDETTESEANGVVYVESMTNVQERLPLDKYQQIVDEDLDFQDTIYYAQFETGAYDISRAYIVKDENGSELIVGVYTTWFGDEEFVVRHCKASDCVSALQTEVETDEEIIWTTINGEIPVRKMLPPFLLRNIIDEYNPDESAVIAELSPNLKNLNADNITNIDAKILSSAKTGQRFLSGTVAQSGSKPRLVIGSAFGKHWNVNFKDFANTMNAAGYDTKATHHVTSAQVDKNFSTLNAKDVFIFYSHGDESASQKRVIGMTTASGYFTSEHYSETRMQQQLALNTGDGPGIVFFAGCKTSDLLQTFDHPNRVFMGFSDSNYAGAVKIAMELFFERWVAGDTLEDAIKKVNNTADLKAKNIELRVNKSANMKKRFKDPTSENAIGTISGKVTNANDGKAIQGALVKLDLSPTPVEKVTDANGEYILQVPESVSGTFALSVSKTGYIPKVVSLTKEGAKSNPLQDFSLKPANEKTVIIEAVPDVHHLGDGSFSGSVNSDFQKASEGATFTATFPITANQLTYLNAKVKMQLKGAECPNTIEINGAQITASLNGSPSSGAFGEYSTNFDADKLVQGSNTITITAHPCPNSGSDLDDLEFANVLIALEN